MAEKRTMKPPPPVREAEPQPLPPAQPSAPRARKRKRRRVGADHHSQPKRASPKRAQPKRGLPKRSSPRKVARGTHPRLALGSVLGLALALLALAIWHHARGPGPWQRVFATREGMTGARTSSGMRIAPGAHFVALPHPRALGRTVEVRYRDRSLVVPVLDVGPWNTDDAYWEGPERPAAERGRGIYRKPTNRAGIDLSDAVFADLGLPDNDYVEWRFVHRGFLPLPKL